MCLAKKFETALFARVQAQGVAFHPYLIARGATMHHLFNRVSFVY